MSVALSWLGDRVQDAEHLHERVALLNAAGIQEPLLSRLANADPKKLRALEGIGMTPQQIQELATKSPTQVLNSTGFGALSPGALSELAARTNLKPSDLISVLMACKTEAELNVTIEVMMLASREGSVSSRAALIARFKGAPANWPLTAALDALKSLP